MQQDTPSTFTFRPARDADADALIALVGSCFDEYPGCVTDVDGEMPELRAIATSFARWNGAMWVGTHDGLVVACGGWTPSHESAGAIEMRKLYVLRAFREHGLAGEIVARIESAANARGSRTVELWSDTRFVTAHRFYERRGYVRTGRSRELHDLSDTTEHHFTKHLANSTNAPGR